MDQQLFRGATQLIPFALSVALLSCNSDDDRAFMTELFLNHRQKLLAYAFSICHDKEQSEDAVQDAFVSLIRIIPRLRAMEDEHLSGYLLITVRNAVYSLYRKKTRIVNAEADACIELPTNMEIFPRTGYTYQDLMEAIPKLSEKDQVLLQMKYFLHQKDAEIAKQLEIKENSARVMVRRARQRLVQVLTEEVESNG